MSRHSERGATLPEMAVVAIVFLTLLFGIIDFGRAMYTYGFVSYLARQGARWAVVRGSTSCTNSKSLLNDCDATVAEIQSYVQSLSEGMTGAPTDLQVTPTWPSCPNGTAGSNDPGCTVSVQVSYNFNFLTWVLPRSPTTYAISSTSQMVISQ